VKGPKYIGKFRIVEAFRIEVFELSKFELVRFYCICKYIVPNVY